MLRLAVALLLLLLAPATVRAQDVIDTIKVGPNAEATGSVELEAGTEYKIAITGQTRVTRGSTHLDHDAVFCFASEPAAHCPSPQRADRLFLSVGTEPPSGVSVFVAPKDALPYSASHSYEGTIQRSTGGRLRASTKQACAAPATCSGPGFEITISAAGCPETARASAVNEVRIVSISGDVDYRRGAKGDWCAARKNEVLGQGDEISTHPDGEVTLAFADNSTVRLRGGTQIRIAAFFTEGGVVRVEIRLANGEIAAKVNRSETTRSDFVVKSGHGHSGSVRGTAFTVFADARSTLFTVSEGSVEVRAGSRSRLVKAGGSAEATGTKLGAPVRRGGLHRAAAVARALRAVARSRCRLELVRRAGVSAKPVKGAWLVSTRVTGAAKGAAAWRVAGRRVRPANALARRVAGHCRPA